MLFFLLIFYDHKLNLPSSVHSTTKDFDQFPTESTKASAPAKVRGMSSALVIPLTIPEPTAITRTVVKTFTDLPSNFQHTTPASTQQARAEVAEAQVLHKDSVVGGDKGHVRLLTPSGNDEDMSDLSHKGSASDLVTVPSLTVASVDEVIPSSTAGMNHWIEETNDGNVSLEIGLSVPSASPLSGDGNIAHISPSFPYSSEVDYQADPADFPPLVSYCPVAGSVNISQDQACLSKSKMKQESSPCFLSTSN